MKQIISRNPKSQFSSNPKSQFSLFRAHTRATKTANNTGACKEALRFIGDFSSGKMISTNISTHNTDLFSLNLESSTNNASQFVGGSVFSGTQGQSTVSNFPPPHVPQHGTLPRSGSYSTRSDNLTSTLPGRSVPPIPNRPVRFSGVQQLTNAFNSSNISNSNAQNLYRQN